LLASDRFISILIWRWIRRYFSGQYLRYFWTDFDAVFCKIRRKIRAIYCAVERTASYSASQGYEDKIYSTLPPVLYFITILSHYRRLDWNYQYILPIQVDIQPMSIISWLAVEAAARIFIAAFGFSTVYTIVLIDYVVFWRDTADDLNLRRNRCRWSTILRAFTFRRRLLPVIVVTGAL